MNIKRIRLEAAGPASAPRRAQAPRRRRVGADTLRAAAVLFNPQAVRAASLTRELAAAFVAGMAVALARYRQKKQVAGGRRSEQTPSAISALEERIRPCSHERRSRQSSECLFTSSRRNCGAGRSASMARCSAAAPHGAEKLPKGMSPRRSIPDQHRRPHDHRAIGKVAGSGDVPSPSRLIEGRFSHAANYDTG
jgi:hypothetical protein